MRKNYKIQLKEALKSYFKVKLLHFYSTSLNCLELKKTVAYISAPRLNAGVSEQTFTNCN